MLHVHWREIVLEKQTNRSIKRSICVLVLKNLILNAETVTYVMAG